MTSFQAKQWLREGIAAARAGDDERARELLLQVVDADEYNEQAWIWLSSVVGSDEDREICLENVLAINPNNNLAKAGLVHLRSRKMPPPPPLEPEPAPAPPAKARGMQTMPTGWWGQPQETEPAVEPDDLLEARMAAAAPIVEKAEADKKPRPKKKRQRARRLVRRLGVTVLLLLGLLAVGVVGRTVLQADLFDPTGRNYAEAMRPLLDDYDAWWAGPYGALVNELNSLCGPGADGWRNQDVLLTCSRYPSVDCALLAAHCGSDVKAMRERVDELSQEAQKMGQLLLKALDATSPPDEVALAHARLRACLQTRVNDADWTGKLARGGPPAGPDHPPACQMFSDAEDEVRRYVGRP